MKQRRYTRTEKTGLIARAERMRDRGLKVPEIAPLLGMPPKTLNHWVVARSAFKPARVGYDPLAKCWWIYIYDTRSSPDDAQNEHHWWACEWMRFATQEAAEDHLALYGEPKVAA